jgi:hypothetical protein
MEKSILPILICFTLIKKIYLPLKIDFMFFEFYNSCINNNKYDKKFKFKEI